jgi:hypothetical protein
MVHTMFVRWLLTEQMEDWNDTRLTARVKRMIIAVYIPVEKCWNQFDTGQLNNPDRTPKICRADHLKVLVLFFGQSHFAGGITVQTSMSSHLYRQKWPSKVL